MTSDDFESRRPEADPDAEQPGVMATPGGRAATLDRDGVEGREDAPDLTGAARPAQALVDPLAALRPAPGAAPRTALDGLRVRWEEFWYSRWGKLIPLAVLALVVLIAAFALPRQRAASPDPTPTAPGQAASTAPLPEVTPTAATAAPAPTVAIPAAQPTSVAGNGAQGTILFHSSLETPGALQLYTIRADGSGLRRIAGTPQQASHPRLSPDGMRIAFVGSNGGGDDIYTIKLDGTDLVRITRGPGNSRFPAWSPDGGHLAFGSDRDGNWEIYTAGADGTNPARLTTNPADDNLPSWSPDGQRIAFQSDREGGRMHIFAMRADGGEVAALTQGEGNDRYPAWSPDGRRIAFYGDRAGGGDQLFALDLDARTVVQLVKTQSRDQLPAWSPDGQWIAFASDRNGGWGIYLLRLRDSAQFLLAKHPDTWAPAWVAGR
jgi:Tol biopolymer transport system component